MKTLVYVSAAAPGFAKADLEDILAASRRNNEAAGITGMLLYADGSIIQVLEGDADRVDETFNRIGRDLRHTTIIKMLESDIGARNFPDWSMGSAMMHSDELPEGLFNLTAAALNRLEGRQAGDEVLTLLKSFYSSVAPYAAA